MRNILKECIKRFLVKNCSCHLSLVTLQIVRVEGCPPFAPPPLATLHKIFVFILKTIFIFFVCTKQAHIERIILDNLQSVTQNTQKI